MIKLIIKCFLILAISISLGENLSRLHNRTNEIHYSNLEYGINIIFQTLMITGVLLL